LNTWRRLEEYGARSGHGGTALTQSRRTWRTVKQWDGTDYRDTSVSAWAMVITTTGKTLYEREWARYRELYPDVDAPEPAPTRAR
jgi:hypothetical protein